MKKFLFILLAINFETTVIASEHSFEPDDNDTQIDTQIDTQRNAKRKKRRDQGLGQFKKKRRRCDNLGPYNIGPLTQADVDEGDLSALEPFIATLSKDGQVTLFTACANIMPLSTCEEVWTILHQEKKALVAANVKNWLTDLSEEDYQAFIARSQQNPLHAASADADDDIDEIEEAALALYRQQQSADNSPLIRAIQEERAKKAQTEAQNILLKLPADVRAALEARLLNELFAHGLPPVLALPGGTETTQS